MGNVESGLRRTEETPVDDVRRVRERLSAEFSNDVEKLADHARSVAEAYRIKLGLKLVVRIEGLNSPSVKS